MHQTAWNLGRRCRSDLWQELLKLIRRIREAEREAIASTFEVLAEDGDRLYFPDLPRALAEIRCANR